jgi:hypothetical protein
MQRVILVTIVICAAFFCTACSVDVAISPRLPPDVRIRLDDKPSITPTIEPTVAPTSTQSLPWWTLSVHSTSETTTSLTSTALLAEPQFAQTCDPSLHDLLSQADFVHLAEAMPLYVLARPMTATATLTAEYGFPAYDPSVSSTLFKSIDGAGDMGDECLTDQSVLWLETQYAPATDGPVSASTPISLASLSIPVQRVCPVSRNVNGNSEEAFTLFMSQVTERGQWADVIVLQQPQDGSVHMIRVAQLPEGCGDEAGGGSQFKRAFCGRLSARTVYGKVVRFMVGCR